MGGFARRVLPQLYTIQLPYECHGQIVLSPPSNVLASWFLISFCFSARRYPLTALCRCLRPLAAGFELSNIMDSTIPENQPTLATRGGQLVFIITWFLLAISILATGTRLLAKRSLGKPFGTDDILALIALVGGS